MSAHTSTTEPHGLVPNLWFNGNAEEVVDFYVDLFPDSTKGTVMPYPETEADGLLDFQKPLAGQPLVIEFTLRGQPMVAVNGGPAANGAQSISLQVDCADQAQIDRYWAALSAVPDEEGCGSCRDRFGVRWEIVPANINELLRIPGAYLRMLPMKKLDIEGLRGE
ncbi:VOC family protein [Galactobacter caseinivorans]|nr:VOC family protein [Galactobacter caseinivorans]